jgi:hypothetical protein
LAEAFEKAPVPSIILNHGASITLSTLNVSINSTALGRVPFASFEFGEIDAEQSERF